MKGQRGGVRRAGPGLGTPGRVIPVPPARRVAQSSARRGRRPGGSDGSAPGSGALSLPEAGARRGEPGREAERPGNQFWFGGSPAVGLRLLAPGGSL